MKQYNRETKRWEEKVDTGKPLKKRELCRGGKPHDYVLIVPRYLHTDHYLSKDEVEAYYAIEDERTLANKAFDDRLAKIGVSSRTWNGFKGRFYICSVCLKTKSEYEPLSK